MLPQCVGPFLLKLCGRGSVGGVLFQGIVVDDKVQTIAVQVGQALAYGGVVPSKLDHETILDFCRKRPSGHPKVKTQCWTRKK